MSPVSPSRRADVTEAPLNLSKPRDAVGGSVMTSPGRGGERALETSESADDSTGTDRPNRKAAPRMEPACAIASK